MPFEDMVLGRGKGLRATRDEKPMKKMSHSVEDDMPVDFHDETTPKGFKQHHKGMGMKGK